MFPIARNWYELLKDKFDSPEFIDLQKRLDGEYQNKTIYPKAENVFNALNLVKFKDVKVVIIGQDPYHGVNQAHGLCFSVEKDVAIPPSLQNIYKELKEDVGCIIPKHGNLTKWARQGVLMLNSVLTVQSGHPNSHKGWGWEKITSRIIELLNDREDPVIFLLWGASARGIGKNIDRSRHYVLTASHPSPMSANQGGWFGCKHFSKANEILIQLGKEPIDWQID